MELRTNPVGSIYPTDVVEARSHAYLPGVVTFTVQNPAGECIEFIWNAEFAELVGRALVLEAKRARADKEKGPR